MASSNHDGNHIPTLVAVLDTGASVAKVNADPSTHGLAVDDDTSGADNGPENSLHDGNHVATLIATSSADGITPIVVYVNTDGELLTDSS